MYEDEDKILYKELSYKVVGLAMEVHQKLGFGFLEKVCENALVLLLNREKINFRQQAPVKIMFEGKIIGNYCSDILVDGKIILEIKTVDNITDANKAQVINYLKATGIKLGMILNFGKRSFEYERLVL